MNPDDPPAVQAIMLMSGSDLKISGNTNQRYNGIMATKGQFDISGNITAEGALISEGASNNSNFVEKNGISGNIILTYDGGLVFPSVNGGGDGTAIVLSWRDLEIARNADVFAAAQEAAGQGGY